MGAALAASGLVDPAQLCIDPGRAAWLLYADLYVLDADGSLHDACLLALAAALATLRLPAAELDEHGNVVRPQGGGSGNGSGGGAAPAPRRLELGPLPVSLTCGLSGGRTVVDLTAEEEGLVEAVVVTTVDPEGNVLGARCAVLCLLGLLGRCPFLKVWALGALPSGAC